MSPHPGHREPHRDHRDPAAQPERTRLAWRRTTLTFTLVVVLAGRDLVASNGGTGAAAVVAVALAALLWVGFLLLAHRRMGALTPSRPATATGATALGAAGVVLVTTVLAGVLVATPD